MNSTSSMSVSVNDSNNASSSSSQTLKPLQIKVNGNGIALAFQIVYIAIGAVGITGNLLALIVFLGHKPLLKRPANYFLVSQCTINLLVSIILILTIMIDGSRWPASVLLLMCYLWNSRAIFAGLFLSSLYNITFMTVERYLEVVYPIKHHLKISKGKVIASIIVATLIGVMFKVCAAFPTVKVSNGICTSGIYENIPVKRVVGVANLLLEYLIPIIVFTFCYIGMARSLRRNSKIIQPGSEAAKPIDPKIARARRNIIKTLFIVVLGFVICTTSKQFVLMSVVLGDVVMDFSGFTFNVAQVFAYLNCCNDPFIYAFHYEEFRVGLRKLFCRFQVMPSGSSTTRAETLNM